MALSIREARPEDAIAISALIIAAIRETNAKDYSASFIDKLPELSAPEHIAERILSRKTYVTVKNGDIVGAAGWFSIRRAAKQVV